jgi:hypothetical protein
VVREQGVGESKQAEVVISRKERVPTLGGEPELGCPVFPFGVDLNFGGPRGLNVKSL